MIKKGIRTNHRIPFLFVRVKMTSMKNSTIYLGFALGLLLCCQQVKAQRNASTNNPTLDVSPLSGKVPLTVVLNGPQELVSRMKRGRAGGFDTSYTFTWGTGQGNLDPNKPQILTHTYNKPGTYYVNASMLRPGSNDEMIGGVSGTATVVVEGWGNSPSRKGASRSTDLFAKCLQLPPKYVRLEKRSKTNPNTIKLWLTVKVPPNFECCIDWGDGTIEQREAPPRTRMSASQLQETTKAVSHTYKKKGRYKVRLKTNNDEPSKKARDVLYYECFDISI